MGFKEALGGEVIPVTAATIFRLRQELIHLEGRLARAEAVCEVMDRLVPQPHSSHESWASPLSLGIEGVKALDVWRAHKEGER